MAPLYTNNTNNTDYTNYPSSNMRAKIVVVDVNIFFNNKKKETQQVQFVIARRITANCMDIDRQLHGDCLPIAWSLPGNSMSFARRQPTGERTKFLTRFSCICWSDVVSL